MTHQPYFNGSTLQDLFLYNNQITTNYWGAFIIFGVFFVALVTLKNFYSWGKSMVSAAYISFVLSLVLRAASVISDELMFLFGLILLLSIGLFVFMGE